MNVGLVIAGGVGHRMGKDIPKQFIELDGKPILMYTLEGFQNHPEIDVIEVVCVEGWEEYVWEQAKKYNISKLKWMTKGGASGQESIRNGVEYLKGNCTDDDIVIIHDGIRPVIDNFVISSVIDTCKKYGNGVTSLPYNEQIFVMDDEISTLKYIPRETLRRVATPQAYKLGELVDSYKKAFENNIGLGPTAYTNTMMADLGVRLYFADGSDKNIKLTTPDDLEIFKGYLKSKK